MYIFLNKGLGMSAGKSAAQAGHAAVEAYRLSVGLDAHQPQEDRTARESAPARHWYKGGHYAKYVMEVADDTQMLVVRDYIEARGFKTALIVDEGHTEDTYFVPTALGVEIVDRAHPHVQETFGNFKLYRDERPQEPQQPARGGAGGFLRAMRRGGSLMIALYPAAVRCCEAGQVAWPDPCPWHGDDTDNGHGGPNADATGERTGEARRAGTARVDGGRTGDPAPGGQPGA